MNSLTTAGGTVVESYADVVDHPRGRLPLPLTSSRPVAVGVGGSLWLSSRRGGGGGIIVPPPRPDIPSWSQSLRDVNDADIDDKDDFPAWPPRHCKIRHAPAAPPPSLSRSKLTNGTKKIKIASRPPPPLGVPRLTGIGRRLQSVPIATTTTTKPCGGDDGPLLAQPQLAWHCRSGGGGGGMNATNATTGRLSQPRIASIVQPPPALLSLLSLSPFRSHPHSEMGGIGGGGGGGGGGE
jgi:hypothetical protein